MRCPQEGIFEAARDERYFLPEAALFGKKKEKNERIMGGVISETLYSCRCECKLKESKACVLEFDSLHIT